MAADSERPARIMRRSERVKALRIGLAKRKASLENSMAHCRAHGREPRPADLQRWAVLAGEIAEFERTLAAVLAGENPPPSPKTGARSKELPDAL